MVGAKKMMRRLSSWPIATLIILLVVICVDRSQGLSRFLIWDRGAIFDGQIWRLATGHFVHFGSRHLIYDITAFGFGAWIIESRGTRGFCGLLLVMSIVIGVVLFITKPGMAFYGGLSGLVCGFVVFIALEGKNDAGTERLFSALLLAAVVSKIAWEAVTGIPVLPYRAQMPFVPIWESHAVGALVALVEHIRRKITRKCVACTHGVRAY